MVYVVDTDYLGGDPPSSGVSPIKGRGPLIKEGGKNVGRRGSLPLALLLRRGTGERGTGDKPADKGLSEASEGR